jgi:hypothetical protein
MTRRVAHPVEIAVADADGLYLDQSGEAAVAETTPREICPEA